jgi:guanylate kinase
MVSGTSSGRSYSRNSPEPEPLIFVLSGPGGVGKGTLVSRLLPTVDGVDLSRSWTTRPRRPGEDAGAYVFVDRDQFLARVADGGFLEWTEFPANGHLYGTPVPEERPGRDLLLEIEVDGARQVKDLVPDAVLIFVVAPSADDQEARLRNRGDAEEDVQRRLEVGRQETAVGTRLADHIVVNDDVDRAAREVADIIVSRRPRQ